MITVKKAGWSPLQNEKAFAWVLILAGIVGLLASFILTVDKIHVLQDPSYNPTCNINPIISCGSVMKTPQASVFGIPNSLFGVVGFTAIITTGVAISWGAKMGKRFWQLFNLGLLLGVGSVAWLLYQSVFVIQTLCIYCMSVWVVVLMLVWYTTLWNNQQGNLRHHPKLGRAVEFAHRNHFGILLMTYFVILCIIVSQFWYYFGSL
jgi:uncharacterized membrane protein